jgi:adenine-specific DNA-methyltransferase
MKSSMTSPTSSLLRLHGVPVELGCLDIPSTASGRIWALPNVAHSERFFESGYDSLESYGYTVKSGYFVWNREQHRYRTGSKPKTNEVPLYWAHNVRANASCKPFANHPSYDDESIGFAAIDRASTAIVHSDAIIVQRTSNSRQKRRLIAAVILQQDVPGQKGFVSENHTLLIVPTQSKRQTVNLTLLCRLLNSQAVDSRFRRISGTVSVSVSALKALPLPLSKHVNSAFDKCPDDDCAANAAYLHSESPDGRQPNSDGDRTEVLV